MSDTSTSSSPSISPEKPARTPWLQTLRVYLEPASLRMLTLGFSAGLPLLLVLGTLSFRLREAGIDRSTIGYLSWVGLAYGFKWVWAPLVDRMPIPLLTPALGRRRSWLLLSQALIVAGLVGMALADPRHTLGPIVWCALAVAFGSATQDIALDAFRIESADANHQAALAASYQTGYRLAMIWAGAGVLWIAARAEVAPAVGQAVLQGVVQGAAQGTVAYQNGAWQTAYLVMAASMAVGVVTVLFSREPAPVALPPAKNAAEWIQGALVAPFADFLRRYGWHAALILALIAVYRISDVVMGIMANPFYVDMGFTKDEVAAVTKVYGVVMTLLGAFVGGVLSMRFGVMRILMLGAILSAASNLLFAWLAGHGHDVTALIAVVSADNLASGIASAAFIAYLSSLTNVSYSATQYALFSSMMLLLPKFVAGFSGDYVDAFGYAHFFTSTALLGLPVLVLVWLASRVQATRSGHKSPDPVQP
ncbi:AmpG family muropeptide MFS transporter [Acidovorax sp. GW101-3H11]|uniref:AmpG family muropeptide MFS transporter n=1 Tax=Acidovorax sp. GW101-3H11 TaxID=1813946 RepID=UPI0007B537DE|nr:MFS transporter [Acidovorax sp. GW101-3H11]KZT15534.1 AmpG family muropeptide MFS transporter [Acidovorax sp. GW101-3H11]